MASATKPSSSERPLVQETLPLSDTAIAQLYRGELGRSDGWRRRLDTTSNWALTVSAATISFSFSAAGTNHVTLLVGIWLVMTFLFIEARRYRYYDLWNRRVRLLETGYWAPLLRHEPVDPDALREYAVELSRPQLRLSFFSALSTRLSRAYGSLLVLLLGAWWVKILSLKLENGDDFFDRADVGPFPGEVIIGLVVLFTLVCALAFVISRVTPAPLGELQGRPARSLGMVQAFLRPYAIPPPRRRTPRHVAPPRADGERSKSEQPTRD